MTLPDEDLPAARHAVEHLFGQCLLRFQANELLMKSIVAGHQLSAPTTDLEEAQAGRPAETARATMGSLVSEIIGSVLAPDGLASMREDQRDPPSIAVTFQIAFPAEEFARIAAELRGLVLLRNTLVHHFLAQHDLRTVDGCLAAQQTLTSALDRATRAYEELLCWASDMEQASKVLADNLAAPDVQALIVHGRVPWHITTIAQALHQAAMELTAGDWASVDTAICWITERYPQEQPEGYGCKSWRQVIHETGRFDLQVRKVDGRRQAWYRARSREST